jgi:hypothetical protein
LPGEGLLIWFSKIKTGGFYTMIMPQFIDVLTYEDDDELTPEEIEMYNSEEE